MQEKWPRSQSEVIKQEPDLKIQTYQGSSTRTYADTVGRMGQAGNIHPLKRKKITEWCPRCILNTVSWLCSKTQPLALTISLHW